MYGSKKCMQVRQLDGELDPLIASANMVSRGTSSSYKVHTTAVCTVRFSTCKKQMSLTDAKLAFICLMQTFFALQRGAVHMMM